MKMLVVNRNCIVSILATVLVSISFFVVGCSETEDDIEDDTEPEVVVNSQPSIGAIPNQTVDMGAEVTVAVNITDADVGDTHTVEASSDNTNVATVSISGTTLTIKGVAVGAATLTVSATDDSGQDNAAAVPVIFTLTVNAVRCVVGLTLKSGESCSYVGGGSNFTFNVREDGFGCIGDALCAGKGLHINTFSASKNPDGSWTINSLP